MIYANKSILSGIGLLFSWQHFFWEGGRSVSLTERSECLPRLQAMDGQTWFKRRVHSFSRELHRVRLGPECRRQLLRDAPLAGTMSWCALRGIPGEGWKLACCVGTARIELSIPPPAFSLVLHV